VCCGLIIKLKKKKRNRMLQAFLAGVIRVISDYRSKTDESSDGEELPDRSIHLPIPYETVLENIEWEFSKDMLLENYKKWLKHDRNIFYEDSRSGDGFNFIYWDFFDRRLKEWSSEDLMSLKNKE
jgi:hypothetical protein